MIDLEDAEVGERIAIREGVEAGAEDDELSDAAADGEGEFVFGVAGAGGNQWRVACGGQVAQHRRAGLPHQASGLIAPQVTVPGGAAEDRQRQSSVLADHVPGPAARSGC